MQTHVKSFVLINGMASTLVVQITDIVLFSGQIRHNVGILNKDEQILYSCFNKKEIIHPGSSDDFLSTLLDNNTLIIFGYIWDNHT